MRTAVAGIALSAFFLAAFPAKAKEKAAKFQPPQVISTVEAHYPVNSVQGGTVVLEVTVAANGEIKDVQVIQGAKGFTQEAVQTIKKWKFAPAKFEDKAVEASLPVAFSFSQPIIWWTQQKK